MIFKDKSPFDRATKAEKLSSYLENKNEMILVPFFSEIILVSVQLAVKLR